MYVPAVVGVPLMTPVDVFKLKPGGSPAGNVFELRPAGSDPAEIEKVMGGVPPLVLTVWL